MANVNKIEYDGGFYEIEDATARAAADAASAAAGTADAKIGDLSDLQTTEKETVVGAINENTTELAELVEQIVAAAVPLGAILPYYSNALPSGGRFVLCNGQTLQSNTYPEYCALQGITASTFTVPDLREATVKGVGTNRNGSAHNAIALGAFQDDRNKAHTHTIAHTHERGTMNITGIIEPVTTNRGQNNPPYTTGCFTGTSHLDYLAASGEGEERIRLDFNAANSWSGSTSAPSNANSGSTGSATTEVKAVGVNFIIRLK